MKKFQRHQTLLFFFSAWTGDFCTVDLNGCSQIHCFEGSQCSDIAAPQAGHMCEPCPPGFLQELEKCAGMPGKSYSLRCLLNINHLLFFPQILTNVADRTQITANTDALIPLEAMSVLVYLDTNKIQVTEQSV